MSASYRFALGDAECLMVSDGRVLSGDPKVTHPQPDPAAVDKLMVGSFLPTDRLVLEANVLLMRRGRLVMFDAGLGDIEAKPAWGQQAGRLMRNLVQAGVDPALVDDIVISHGHGEHTGGMTAPDGSPNYPNARIYISRNEFDHWTDPEATGPRWAFDHGQAVRNLLALRDRITFIEDGEEFLPGVRAIATPGHTVAHMAFLVTAGPERLFHTADLARHHILNVERPEWQFIGDADAALAVQSRLRLFERIARERAALLSYHFPWPGLGHLAREGDSYRYYPSAMDLSCRE